MVRMVPRRIKRRTIGDYLVTFAPWIAYVFITEISDSWGVGFVVGLTISAGIVIWRTIRRDSRFIDVGTLSYCAAMTAVSLIYPDSPLRPYNIPLSSGAVGLLSLASIVIRPPFTYRIACDKVPEWILKDVVHQARLLRAHMTATRSWAVAQTVGGALGAVLIAVGLAPFSIIAQLIGTVVPVGITRLQHERFMHSVMAPGNSAVAPENSAENIGDEVGEDHVVAESDKGVLGNHSVPDQAERA
jgi:hypothetical protein